MLELETSVSRNIKIFFFLAPNLTTYHMLGVSETQATTFLEYNGLCYFLTSTQIENV